MSSRSARVNRCAAVGMFDGVHLGHQEVVHQVCMAASCADLMPTIFTFDHHPLTTISPEKAPPVLTTLSRRSALLVEAGAEDVQILHFTSIRDLTAEQFLQLLKASYGVSVLITGFNHHFGRGAKGTFEDYKFLGAKYGIRVERGKEKALNGVDVPISSSSVRKAIMAGKMELASMMLGHTYCFSGYVVHGRRIGQQLGFPTANIVPFVTNQCLPASGAYAAMAYIGQGLKYPAMVNIGSNPTVTSDNVVTIEANIIGYEGDLYGAIVSLDFLTRLREERRFENIEALVSQLYIDRQNTIKITSKP